MDSEDETTVPEPNEELNGSPLDGSPPEHNGHARSENGDATSEKAEDAEATSDAGNGEVTGEMDQEIDEDKLGHMCIVLNPQVRKQLMRGEPLIIGTSTASVEAFFHRLISVCQVGAHMPVMFQTLNGAVTVANIKKRKNELFSGPNDRYPMPFGAPPKKKKRTAKMEEPISMAIPEIPSDSGLPPNEDPLDELPMNTGEGSILERDEIPMEAIRLYLKEQRYFPGWNANAKRNLRKRCKDFLITEDRTLYYKTKKGELLPCVEDPAQRINLIWENHVIDHRRRDGLLSTLKARYYWKGMFGDITKVLETCEVCTSQRELRKAREEKEHAEDQSAGTDLTASTSEAETPKNKRKGKRKVAIANSSDLMEQITPDTLEVLLGSASNDNDGNSLL